MDENQTREAIMRVGRHLLQSRGYGELRYAEIGSAVGIRNASIHYYFPTKVDLGVALIDEYRIELLEKLELIDDEVTLASEKLERYVDLYRAILDEDKEHMCPGGMLAAEVVSLPVELQQAVQRFFDDNEAWLIGVLTGADARTLPGAASVAATARQITVVLQGAVLMARLHRDPETLDVAANWLRRELWGDRVASRTGESSR